jgi:hypothetical protein
MAGRKAGRASHAADTPMRGAIGATGRRVVLRWVHFELFRRLLRFITQ